MRISPPQQSAYVSGNYDYFFRSHVEYCGFRSLSGEGDSDFSDAGTAPAQQQQEKQKVVKLMQRQQKAQPKAQQTFRVTAVSDITLPDMNELDVKDLAPVVEAPLPPCLMQA